MVLLSGLEADLARPTARVRRALASGAGLETFREIVSSRGATRASSTTTRGFRPRPTGTSCGRTAPGWSSGSARRRSGRAAVGLGAGRDRLDTPVDPGVGLVIVAPVGADVQTGDPILEIHHRNGRGLPEACQLLASAIDIADTPAPARPLVLHRIERRSAA